MIPPSLESLLAPTPLLTALSSLLSLLIGAVVLNRNPQRAENQAFFAMTCLSLLVNLNAASLFFGGPDGTGVPNPVLHPQFRMVFALGGFTLFALVLFIYAFPFNRRPVRVVFWGLLLSTMGHFFGTLYYFETAWMQVYSKVTFGLALGVALWGAWQNRKALERADERLGLALIHTVLGVRFALSGLTFALPRIEGSPDHLLLVFYLILSPPLFSIILAYGLMRFQLFDPKRLFSRSLALFLVSASALGIFMGVIGGIQLYLQALLGLESSSLLSTTLVLAVLLTAFHPVRLRVEAILERRFNPELVAAREATRAYLSHTRSLLEQSELYRALEQTVHIIAPDNKMALLMGHPRLQLHTREGIERFLPARRSAEVLKQAPAPTTETVRDWPEAQPLLDALQASRRSHLTRRARYGLPRDVEKAAEGISFTQAIPVWRENRVEGVLLLDGVELDRERLQMLIELSGYLGLQWENAALYAQALEANEALKRSNRDIERSNKDLDDTRLFLESLFESVPAGIAVLDHQARIVRWNRTMEKMTGVAREEALEHPDLLSLLPDLSLTGGADATRQGFTTPLKRRITLGPVGKEVIVHMRLALFKDRQGGPGGTVLILTDVTEQVTMQAALEDARRLAALGQFAAAMAHELRTPLTSIQMNVQILSGKVDLPPEDFEYFDIVLTELDRLNKTISEILDFAKPMRLELAPLLILDLVDEVVRGLYFLLAERGVEVQVESAEGLEVQADGERLKQVLIILLDNASQAMQEDPARREGGRRADEEAVIRVRAAVATGPGGVSGIAVSVADAGRGIPESDLSHIFEPFYTTRARGTGLGLAVAKKILEAHQGQLQVESVVGEGTTFTLWLPQRRGV